MDYDRLPSQMIVEIDTRDLDLMEEMLVEKFQIKLRTLSRRYEALIALYKTNQVELDSTISYLKQTKQDIEKSRKINRVQEGKIDLIKRYIASRRTSVKKRWDAVTNLKEELKQHITRRAYQLTQDVFPIDELNLHEQSISLETSPLLTFSDDFHHQIEQSTAHSIVEPWLPSTGDYSAYSLWVNDNKDQLQAPMDGSPDRNPAFRIGAALGYTTQLVMNLATYMDVILPARLDFDIFNRDLLDDGQFSYSVAKLNTNVIHLCAAQGRSPTLELNDENDDRIATKIESKLTKDLSLVRDKYYAPSGYSAEAEDNDDDVSDSEWVFP